MTRIFKTAFFNKWQIKSTEIRDSELTQSIEEISNGLFDANLGGNLYKKRIARKGGGKRSSHRTIIAGKISNGIWIFIYGFSKSELGNINQSDLAALKILATDLLSSSVDDLSKILIEIKNEN